MTTEQTVAMVLVGAVAWGVAVMVFPTRNGDSD